MDYEVIVVGGGAGGVAAAVGAAWTGARTLLVESGPCLGGAATQKGVETYCGLWTQADQPEQAVFGVAERVLEQLRDMGGVEECYRVPPTTHSPSTVIALIDAETVKVALDRVCANAGVDVLLDTIVTGAARDGDRIASASLHDDGGTRAFSAAAFVDASGEGNLAMLAGASVRYGNHGVAQAGTLAVRYGGVAPDADITPARWKQAISEARARGVLRLEKEDGLIFRLPVSGALMSLHIDESYDALNGASMSRAERSGREKARAVLAAIRTIPGYERAYIASTGPKFGTRESRHVDALYQVTEDDVTGGARFDDSIALGAWPMEHHPADGSPVIWKDVKDKGTFDIPLRTLMSRNTSNLLAAGRVVDGDRGGGGAMRVMGTAFATGHAAGVAAALCAQTGSVHYADVRARLYAQGAKL